MVKMFFILFGVLAFCQAVCGQSVSKVWVADRKELSVLRRPAP